jgi:RND family efflux transporter MFP subunit
MPVREGSSGKVSIMHTYVHKLFVATACISAVAAWAGCARHAAPVKETPAVQVVVTTPVKKSIVEWDEYVGRFDAVDFVEVRARVSGYLQSIHFEEGQVVKQGDLLCVIDPRPFAAELNRAKAQTVEAKANLAQSTARLAEAQAQKSKAEAGLDYAQTRLARSKKLLPGNTITQEEFDQQQSELLQAQADVEGAKALIETAKAGIATATASIATAQSAVEIAALNLEYTRVISPITGRISRRDVTEGNLIGGGSLQSTLLTTIVSLDPIHCYFDADEQAFLKYTRLAMEGKRRSSRDVKNPVYVALGDEKDGFRHQGHMDFVDNRLDPNTGTMRARAIFANPDHTLTPGLFARLRLPGSGKYDAVLVPDSAIGNDQSEKFVFVVDANNKVRRQLVEIGPRASGLRIIRKGLDGSERIVLRGLQRVRPGIDVVATVQKVEAKSSDGLPDDYQPVPKEQWISIHPQTHRERPQVSLTNATSESTNIPAAQGKTPPSPVPQEAK